MQKRAIIVHVNTTNNGKIVGNFFDAYPFTATLHHNFPPHLTLLLLPNPRITIC